MAECIFMCYYDFCGKEFNNKYNLKRHINAVHLQIKFFKCEICAKELVSKISYKDHLYGHQQMKPLKCPYPGCELVFSRSSLLCSHKKCHGTEKMPAREPRRYEKRKDPTCLPEVNERRRIRQETSKIPLHHLLIS